MDAPKTRQEKKGRDKKRDSNPYSAKHVRQQQLLLGQKEKTKTADKKKR
jgi:hypothetical protein